jgi:hypothetical protein
MIGNKVTVTLNGVKIHDNVTVDKATGSELDTKVTEPGPFFAGRSRSRLLPQYPRQGAREGVAARVGRLRKSVSAPASHEPSPRLSLTQRVNGVALSCAKQENASSPVLDYE